MSKHGTPLSIGQFAEFAGAVLKALPRDIDPDVALKWAQNGAALKNTLGHALRSGIERQDKLLEYLHLSYLSGAEHFVAADHFGKQISPTHKVSLKPSFHSRFLMKVEENVPVGDAKIYHLLKWSANKPIMKELGGKHEMYLADLWSMLEKQPNGEVGDLIANGWVNIFFILDKNGEATAVDVAWSSWYGVWNIGAVSITDPNEWRNGYRVICR